MVLKQKTEYNRLPGFIKEECVARQNARSDQVCLDFSLVLSLYQDKESK